MSNDQKFKSVHRFLVFNTLAQRMRKMRSFGGERLTSQRGRGRSWP